MPRPSNRASLLRTGGELLASGSFNATGVQQITDAAGVPKGSFYNYFSSKEAFGIAVVRHYVEASVELLEAILIDEGGTPLERLQQLFARWLEREREERFARGCLAARLCQELAETHPDLREAAEAYFRQVQRILAEVLFEAQQAGELSPELDPDELAGFLYNSWQGALLRMKAARSDRPLQQFRDTAFRLLLRPSSGPPA